MSPWGWRPERNEGVWRYGASGLRPFVAAAPWITVLLLILQFSLMEGTFLLTKGVLFDLPDAGLQDGEATGLVALVMPVSRETLVFFDDSRFMLADDSSTQALAEQLADRVSRAERRTLLVLADRRVSAGDLVKFAALAKKSGVEKILFAEKKGGGEE